MDAIQEAVMQALQVIVVTLIGVLSKKAVDYLNSKDLAEKLGSKKEIIMIAVEAVEKLWGAGGGPEKLKLARQFALKELAENNIKITDDELDLFIESSVFKLKESAKELDAFTALKKED